MSRALSRIDAVLRGRPEAPPWGTVVGCGLLYGAVMGGYGGLAGDRPWQVIYSAVKVPLLLLATLLLSLPSFFVLNSLRGLRPDFPAVLRAVVGSQAGLAIILVALAPLTILWYASTADYHGAILFNGLMFGVASLGAQAWLARAYRPLVARDPRHRATARAWVVLYAFVGIQMGWTLRPFLGDPALPVRFFRGGPVENAYVIVAGMIWEAAARVVGR